MKGDIIPGLKPQSFALTVMEQRPYSAYMTVDEENSAPRAPLAVGWSSCTQADPVHRARRGRDRGRVR